MNLNVINTGFTSKTSNWKTRLKMLNFYCCCCCCQKDSYLVSKFRMNPYGALMLSAKVSHQKPLIEKQDWKCSIFTVVAVAAKRTRTWYPNLEWTHMEPSNWKTRLKMFHFCSFCQFWYPKLEWTSMLSTQVSHQKPLIEKQEWKGSDGYRRAHVGEWIF